MADLSESAGWVSGIYQIETTDPVVGGPPNLGAGQGIANVQAAQLAARTKFLRDAITAYTALPGATIAPGRLAWSSDGVLMKNATVANITITGTDAASLSGDGLSDYFAALEASAVAKASPVGSLVALAHSFPPSGWLECDGSALSRTTYASLFSAIGETYGAGNGTTTFNIPDMRGEFLRGWDHGRGVDSARAFGSTQDHALEEHRHWFEDSGTNEDYQEIRAFEQSNTTNPNQVTTGSERGDVLVEVGDVRNATVSDETRPRNVAMMFCIKY